MFTACGGGDSTTPPPADGGSDVTVIPDGGNADHHVTPDGNTADTNSPDTGNADTAPPVDAGVDAPPVDAAPPPGVLLNKGLYTLWAVTSDGYAIYTDQLPAAPAGNTINVYAKPIASGGDAGAGQIIATFPTSNPSISNVGKVVFIFKDVAAVAGSPQRSALGVWTSAGGYKDLTTTSLINLAAASPDGTAVMYLSNVAAAGNGVQGDLYGSLTAAGSNPVALETAIVTDAVTPGVCFPRAAFAGSGATTVGFAIHCPIADAGTQGTLTSWNSTLTKVSDVPNVTGSQPSFTTNTAGTEVFTQKPDGTGIVIAFAAGVAGVQTTIDSKVFAGILFGDGSQVVYGTSVTQADGGTGANLKHSNYPVANPTALVTDATKFAGFFNGVGVGISPDYSTMYTFTAQNASTGLTDLWLASTTVPGPNGAPKTQLTASTKAGLFASGFTADSKYATWYDPIITTTGLGSFKATNIATGVTVPVGSGTVWNNFPLGAASKITFNDHGSAGPSTNVYLGTATIEVIDLASGSPPTTVVAGADVNYLPSFDGSQLVFTYTIPNSTVSGLYVIPTP